jgi:hypothetical protein
MLSVVAQTRLMLNYKNMLIKGTSKKLTLKKRTSKELISYFLSYFPVVNQTKDTTSLRLVFDVKAKDRSGRSMNGAIEKGPNRLNALFAILLCFRRYR